MAPKFDWAIYGWAKFFHNMAGPNFSTIWLGQNLAGPIMAGPLFWAFEWASF
jgi:hypothetical protein